MARPTHSSTSGDPTEKTITVKQIRSTIANKPKTRGTMRALGLRKIGDSFSRIAVSASGELTIGAMTPLSAIEHSADVLRAAPVMTESMFQSVVAAGPLSNKVADIILQKLIR